MAKKNIEGKIWQLENQLETALRPVSPRPEYRSYLHDRLVEARVTPARKRPEFSPRLVFMAAVGLTGTVVLMIAVIKALGMLSRSNQKHGLAHV
jgi:hypothetical protein